MLDVAGSALAGVYDRLSRLVSGFHGTESSAGPQKAPASRDDVLSLSSEALDIIRSLQNGQSDLIRRDLDFARDRLGQLREQTEAYGSLLSGAGTDQAETIANGLRQLGSDLKALGRQIGALLSRSTGSVSIEVVRAEFSQEFNGAAAGNGSGQNISGDFSFLKISVSEQSSSLAQDENGLFTLQTATRQTEIVVAELSVSQDQTLSAGGSGLELLDGLGDVIQTFQDAAGLFARLAQDTRKKFGGIDRLLPVPFLEMMDSFFARSGGSTAA